MGLSAEQVDRSGPGLGSWIGRWWGSRGFDARVAQEAFDRQHETDERGWWIHLFFALLAGACVGGGTSVAEVGQVPLVVCAAIRLPFTWRVYGSLMRQPVFGLFAAWYLWQAATVMWTPDVGEWLDQWGATRFVLVFLALWPVMEGRGVVIAGLVIGFLIGNVAQALHAIGVGMGMEGLYWTREAGRNSVWWDPAVAGSLLMAPLGLHLGGAVFGRGVWRWLGVVGVVVTLLGILATGTRSAWIVGPMVVVLAIGLGVWRGRYGWSVRGVVGLGAVLVVGAGVAWVAIGDDVAGRVREGVEEVRQGVVDGDYETSTGRRLVMYRLAWEAFMEHPVRGVGVGGFETYWEEHRIHEDDETFAHAHCTPAQIAATTGAVGLVVASLLGVAMVIGAFGARVGAGREGPDDSCGYGMGPALALVGLLLMGMFDSIHVNAQTSLLLFVLAGLCTGWRPEPRRLVRKSAEGSA